MVHKGGRGVKNLQKTVHMVYGCPLFEFYSPYNDNSVKYDTYYVYKLSATKRKVNLSLVKELESLPLIWKLGTMATWNLNNLVQRYQVLPKPTKQKLPKSVPMT